MSAFAEFWAESGWGDTFHQVRYITVSGTRVRSVHSGLDISEAGARDEVPALAAGVVAEVGRRTDVGQYVIVQITPTLVHIYCHVIVLMGVKPGAQITLGQVLALIAGENDQPGSMWTGPHLHFMVAATVEAIRTRSLAADPAPHIRAALAAPFDESEEDDVKQYSLNTLIGKGGETKIVRLTGPSGQFVDFDTATTDGGTDVETLTRLGVPRGLPMYPNPRALAALAKVAPAAAGGGGGVPASFTLSLTGKAVPE